MNAAQIKEAQPALDLPALDHALDQPVLLVDDNPQNLRLAGFLLRSAGWVVHTAESAERALDLLASVQFSLALVDIQLPGMDGMELTRRIRSMPACSALPVVALTAYAMRGDEERMRAAGCDGYIAKPIDTRTFADRVSKYRERPASDQVSVQELGESGDGALADSPEIARLKSDFISQTRREVRDLLLLPDFDLGDDLTFKTLHRWKGMGSSIGLPGLTDLAREAESHSRQARPVRGPLIRPFISSIVTLLEAAGTPDNTL
jgi:two-component system, cell cycle response regulator DivK